jgi:hypothetical protein
MAFKNVKPGGKTFPSMDLLYKLIKAKAKEDCLKLSDEEIKEFFEDVYWRLDSDLDLAIHNEKAFD